MGSVPVVTIPGDLGVSFPVAGSMLNCSIAFTGVLEESAYAT
jgi:hypothetical protein